MDKLRSCRMTPLKGRFRQTAVDEYVLRFRRELSSFQEDLQPAKRAVIEAFVAGLIPRELSQDVKADVMIQSTT